MIRIQRLNPIPFISFLIIQIFWVSLYIQGIFNLLGGIRTQIVLLFIWLLTILIQPRRNVNVVIGRLHAHRLELILLAMFVMVTSLNLWLGRGAMAYAYFVKSLLLFVTYMTVIIHLKQDYARYAQANIAITFAIGVAALYVLSLIVSELRVNPFSTTHYFFQNSGDVQWFGSWSFYVMCAIPVPCLIATALRLHGILRVCSLALCLLIIVMLVLSTFAAAVILLLMGFVGLFLFSIRKPKAYIAIALIALLCIFVSKQFSVTQIVQIKQLGTKISTIFDIKLGSDYGEPNDPRIRLCLIKNSWDTFTQHPLFGVGTEDKKLDSGNVGNHSGIIDSLAQFGILGVICYAMFLAICFRRLLVALIRDSTDIIHQARFVTFIIFLVGAMVEPMLFDVGISALVFILSFSPIGISLNHTVANVVKGGAHA